MPPIIQQLMRHESIDTTMRFYVGRNAEAAADALWQAVANVSANTGDFESIGLLGRNNRTRCIATG